ncbi:hypothetical protein [Tuberibacillus sp. Marseille-P3662]|uniref:hypothetical protein n=1 Tax=Tuberibacillus sp. Marseille-P3662 TaxID=1965358 RepID=UPI000A1CA4BB|nr:hypothetical protein [Tuberibacillus sp. Marseille-P3662]
MNEFKISGTFHNKGYFINLPIDTVRAESQEKAFEIAKNMDRGKVFFDSDSTHIIHQINGQATVINADNINYCEVSVPSNQIKHVMLMGSPVYEQDYHPISLTEVTKALLKQSVEWGRKSIPFESISYGIDEVAPEKQSIRGEIHV